MTSLSDTRDVTVRPRSSERWLVRHASGVLAVTGLGSATVHLATTAGASVGTVVAAAVGVVALLNWMARGHEGDPAPVEDEAETPAPLLSVFYRPAPKSGTVEVGMLHGPTDAPIAGSVREFDATSDTDRVLAAEYRGELQRRCEEWAAAEADDMETWELQRRAKAAATAERAHAASELAAILDGTQLPAVPNAELPVVAPGRVGNRPLLPRDRDDIDRVVALALVALALPDGAAGRAERGLRQLCDAVLSGAEHRLGDLAELLTAEAEHEEVAAAVMDFDFAGEPDTEQTETTHPAIAGEPDTETTRRRTLADLFGFSRRSQDDAAADAAATNRELSVIRRALTGPYGTVNSREVVEMHRRGMPMVDIAAAAGLSVRQVQAQIRAVNPDACVSGRECPCGACRRDRAQRKARVALSAPKPQLCVACGGHGAVAGGPVCVPCGDHARATVAASTADRYNLPF